MTQTVPDISPLMPMHQDPLLVNTLRLRRNQQQFAEDFFNCISFNEKILLTLVYKGPINNIHIPALAKIMAWRRPGDKPLSEPMMVGLPTHICVNRSQWIKAMAAGTLQAGERKYAVTWRISFNMQWKSAQIFICALGWKKNTLQMGRRLHGAMVRVVIT